MPFDFKSTPFNGLQIIQPRVFKDERGFFMETYKKSEFYSAGITEDFVQDNHSFSSRGVLRGIHFQRPPHAQGKLVRVVKGAEYNPESDGGVRWNDPDLAIKWPDLKIQSPLVSDKDAALPYLKEIS